MQQDVIECEVLIVGGGPAGLSVASSLDDDIDTIVVHHDAEIGKPVRTSGGSWAEDMQELGIPDKYYNFIKQLDLYSDNEEVSFKVTSKTMVVLEITGLYKYLASLSDDKKRKIFLSSKFIGTQKMEDGRYCSSIRSKANGDKKILSKYIIDASGWHCAVLSDLGLAEKPDRLAVGIEYEYELGDNDPERAVFFFGSSILAGYGWIYPTGDNKLRIGAGIIKPDTNISPKKILDDFLASNQLARYNIKVGDTYEARGGVLPSAAYEGTLVYGNVIRTGDSANFATPTAGEGVRTAIKYGRVLGDALSCVIKNDTVEPLSDYENFCYKELHSNYKFGFMTNKKLATYQPSNWDASIRRLARLSEKEFVSLIRSEFSLKMIVTALYKIIKAKIFK